MIIQTVVAGVAAIDFVGLYIDLLTFHIGLAEKAKLPTLLLAAAKLYRIKGNAHLHAVRGLANLRLRLVVHVVGQIEFIVPRRGRVVFPNV